MRSNSRELWIVFASVILQHFAELRESSSFLRLQKGWKVISVDTDSDFKFRLGHAKSCKLYIYLPKTNMRITR